MEIHSIKKTNDIYLGNAEKHFGKMGKLYSPFNDDFVEQKVVEQKVDKFFKTSHNTSDKKNSWKALLGSSLAVLGALLLIGRKQKPDIKLNSLKNAFNLTQINYGIKEIFITSSAGIAGGLASGLLDKKENNKLGKLREAAFQMANIAFPTTLVGLGLKLCEKSKKLNNPLSKIIAVGIALPLGIFSAVKTTHHLEDNVFDKNELFPNKKMKKKDFIIHVDDVIGALVIAKIPFIEKLHVDKILPIIYAWCGYRVGNK